MAQEDSAHLVSTADFSQSLLTTPLRARKGRASYLGERSAGHQDPGATSTALLLDAAVSALSGSPG